MPWQPRAGAALCLAAWFNAVVLSPRAPASADAGRIAAVTVRGPAGSDGVSVVTWAIGLTAVGEWTLGAPDLLSATKPTAATPTTATASVAATRCILSPAAGLLAHRVPRAAWPFR